MGRTVAEFCANEVLVANGALKCLQPGPNFPVGFFPWDALFPQKLDELVELPVAICNMLRDD